MIEFIDAKCPGMKYVDIASGCGFSKSFIYNLRARRSDSHQMRVVIKFMYGLSGLLSEDVEDLFVEYILGSVLGEYPDVSFGSICDWLVYYKGGETFKDLSDRIGLDQGRMTAWIHHGSSPSDTVLRWVLIALDGSSEEQCRSFFRVAIGR